ncbi:MAG: nickel insertion protein, partial [Candidatus Omnitrophota bacterium]
MRILLGSSGSGFGSDEKIVMETSIDDMNPQIYEYVTELLFAAGAQDVYITPVYMKKSRPGIKLEALLDEALKEKIASIIFRETTTSGIRFYKVRRLKLDRHIKKIHTRFGRIKVKYNRGPGNIESISPEYEDCKRVASRLKVPLKAVLDEAKRSAA